MQQSAGGEDVPAPQPSITASTSMLAVFSRRGRGRGRGAEKEHTTRIVAKWLAQHGWRYVAAFTSIPPLFYIPLTFMYVCGVCGVCGVW